MVNILIFIFLLVGGRRHIPIKVFLCLSLLVYGNFISTFLFCVPEDLNTNKTGIYGSSIFIFFTEVLPPPIAIGLALAMMIGGLRLILHGEEEAKKNAAAHALYNKDKTKDKDKDTNTSEIESSSTLGGSKSDDIAD